MSAATDPYYFAYRPLSNHENIEYGFPEFLSDIQGELDQQTLLTEAFSMVTKSELDPWIIDSRSEIASHPDWQVWDGSFDGRPQHDSTQASNYKEATTLLQLREAYEGCRISSQLATERALFMTPPFNTRALSALPESPIPELCDTPEAGQAPSMMWETDPESEDMRGFRSPTSAIIEAPSFDFFPDLIDDVCLTPLEMPDGSLRMSSNWLPVDTTAGFIIGSHIDPDKDASNQHMEMESLDGIRDAFISINSAGWKFDG